MDDRSVNGTSTALSKALFGGNRDLTVIMLETMAAHMPPGTEPAVGTHMLDRMARIRGVQSRLELNRKLCIPVKFQPGRSRFGVRVLSGDDDARVGLNNGPLLSLNNGPLLLLKAECLELPFR